MEEYIYIRNAAYQCATHSHYTLRGDKYSDEIKIIQINLSYGLNDSELFRIYKIQDDKLVQYVKNFLIYEINMDKYLDFWYTGNNKEIESNKFIIMLGLEKEDLSLLAKNNKEIKKYMDELVNVNANPDFFEYMSAEEDYSKRKNTEISNAIDEDIKIGIEQGIEQNKRNIVKKMLETGIPVNQIIEITGFTEEQINELLEK